MQNNSNSFETNHVDSYHADDVEEDNDAAFVWRTMEIELMSDQLPLFVKTANGRLNSATKRDCFTINPRMTNPEWMKCYQFIGAVIGRIMVKSFLYFGVPMAPTFWMLTQKNEIPSVEDFAREDARLKLHLDSFEEELEDGGNWPEDESWTWINSADKKEELPGHEGKVVTRENFAEYKNAIRDQLVAETAEQMKHIKMGIKGTLGEMNYIRSFLNWHDLMVLVETKILKNFDKEDGIAMFKENTVYEGNPCEDENIARFWKIFDAFNYEDKKADRKSVV